MSYLFLTGSGILNPCHS